ncbi:uncharacterized protein LOC131429116 [Malaya genurostris]|uniref:uncharacterized protein LOC131429116 n=1 Tax=Malaya genurostris TaxID=325434 RepID=UPI0026F3FF10|nr:uncharacterized protein LOC131429116 [Malaya genurostris]
MDGRVKASRLARSTPLVYLSSKLAAKLKLVNWNACSLKSKIIELGLFLEEKRIDIAFITETHLKPEVNINIPGFRLVRRDRPNLRRGGVAIAIRNNINCQLLPSFQLQLIEAVGVEITTSVGTITFIVAYCPKQASVSLRQDIIKLTRRQGQFIIAGDLNAKHQSWGNLRRNQNGEIWSNDADEGHYIILDPDGPTRLNRSGIHATLDLYITNTSKIIQTVVYQKLSSEHYPVVNEVGSSVNRSEYSRRNYHLVNWGRFQQCVDNNMNYSHHPETQSDIDHQLHSIVAAISQARPQYVPASRMEAAVRNNPNNLLVPNDFSEELEITAHEPSTYIKTSKNMKAPGFDNILNIELKHMSFEFFNHLATIFNQCLRFSYFPSLWKSAKVIPIMNPGKDPSSSKSYRPISLLSGLSKLFERAIYRRLLASTEQHNNILLDEQFGFRQGRSTVHQLTRVTNILKWNKSLSKTSAMALLDVETAFDNITLLTLLIGSFDHISATGSYSDNAIEEQHRVINEMNQNFTDLEQASEKLIDLGTFVGRHKVPPKTVKITNTVAVKVPVPYPVRIPQPIPIPIPVNKPIPVPVTKIIKVTETTPVNTVPSYSTTALQNLLASPTVSSFSSRSSNSNSHLLTDEQEVSHTDHNEHIHEFTRSFPVHSVFNVGADYNPYMGNRAALTKQAAPDSVSQHTHYSEPEQAHRGRSTNIYSSNSIPEIQTNHEPRSRYRVYYTTEQSIETHSSDGQEYHKIHQTPEEEVISHSYKHPKSAFYPKSYEKYPKQKFSRPSYSVPPTTPTFSASEQSSNDEYHFERPRYEDHQIKSSPPVRHFQTVKDSYPQYEHPDFKQYHYQKPNQESYSYSEKPHYKSEKYSEHYTKPTPSSYTSANHDPEHREVEESKDSATHYRQYEYRDHAEQYDEHKSPTQQYESRDHDYRKPIHNEETYAHAETREPQYTPNEYKTYYANPSPVSEALSYTEQSERPRETSHKQYYEKPESYRPNPEKEHQTRYSSKPNTLEYSFPSDSHLHPTYSESSAPKHPQTHHYYASTPEHPSFDETHESEHHKYYHQAQHSPSPAPSSHEPTYHHGEPEEEDYHHYSSHGAHHRHQRESGDMQGSSSTDHEAYERAVERDYRAAYSSKHIEYTHEHLHHHHPATTDGRSY